MMRFQHMEYFWFLLVPMLLVLLFVLYVRNRRHQISRIGDTHLVQALMPGFSMNRKGLRFFIFLGAMVVLIIGLANLQAGRRTEKISRKGIDVMIALDVSKSMLARDIAPNRLEKARLLIYRLLEKLGNDRVGLILFAGRAYVSVPLTVDFAALKMNLATANPDMLPTQGTVLGEAIQKARTCFNAKETKYKSIVLISDGEDHDDQVNAAVKEAVEEGIMIHTVGIGSPEGSPIFDEDTKANKTDASGQEIISKLNENILKDIASASQGVYLRLQNAEQASSVISQRISKTEQKNFGDTLFADYESYFQYFIGLALLLFLVEPLIPERK